MKKHTQLVLRVRAWSISMGPCKAACTGQEDDGVVRLVHYDMQQIELTIGPLSG